MSATAPEKTSKRSKEKQETATAAVRPAAVGQTPKSRRRLWGAALGISLMLIAGLATWYITTNTSQTVTVLTTGAEIQRGEEITQGDLTTISIAGGQATDTVAASEASTIVGQVAAVDLPAGSLITSSNVINTLPVPEGKTIVGVSVTSAQLPAYGLTSGDQVRIVDTPVAQGEPPVDDPQSFRATVFTSKFDETNNAWVVDLVVPSGEAPSIAARAATQRVAIILDSLGE